MAKEEVSREKERHRNRRRSKVLKDDRLYRIEKETGNYGKNFCLSDYEYDGDSLHHSKAYIKGVDWSESKPVLKREASKRSRQIPLDETANGNHYRRSFDYKWELY